MKQLLKQSLIFILFMVLGFQGGYAQKDGTITIKQTNVTLIEALNAIEQQGVYSFLIRNNDVDLDARVSIDMKNASIHQVMQHLLNEKNISYSVEGRRVMVYAPTTREVTQVYHTGGMVKDDIGEPIIGANILEKGTTNGTVTDMEGKFSLSLNNPDAELEISYIGYITQVVPVNRQRSLMITMKEDLAKLDEVVVIGYGTQKKSDVSGSVVTVSGEKINKLPTVSADAALQGMAPGLSVNFGSGAPGTSATLQVRGVTTWGTSNEPLVVIDGVPGDISFLNPEDIKSMSVLKDAATAAIYGARAAAGVILVETYRGSSKQEPKIQFSSYVGIDDLPKRMELCNSSEFIKVRKMALTNAGYTPAEWPRYIQAYEADPSRFADTDWQNEYYRRGINQKYNIGYTAGNEKMNLALSAFYSQKDGIVIGTDETKYGFRMNSDVVRGKFKLGESLSYNQWKATPEYNTGFHGMFQVMNIEPLVFVYDEHNNGGFGGAVPGMDMSDAANPVAFSKLVRQSNSSDYLSASGYIQFEPIRNLVLKFNASRSIYWGKSRTFVPTYEVGILKLNTQASLGENRSKNIQDLYELTANWEKTFKESHHVQALLGASQEEHKYESIYASGKKFENNDMDLLEHAQTDYSASGDYVRSGLRSLFGRLSYNYKYRYLLMASARYDGSSRFASGNKWGFFPSVSLGWNVANEPFWEKWKDDVSTLKLRLSYGGLGNQSIGVYKYIPQLSSDTSRLNYPFDGKQISLGYGITSLASENIKWETTIYKNIGVDIGFWNNKLELSFEAYIKDTHDMLSSKNISLCTGFGGLTVNDGKLRTKGFEVQAIYHGNVGHLRYNVDMNVSHFKSVLKHMADPNYMYEYGPARTYVGGEIGEFWVIKTNGIFQSQQEVDEWNSLHGLTDEAGNWIPLQPSAKPGDYRFIDQNGDGLLDNNDKVKMGSGNPKANVGLNISLQYRQFDLIANFYGSFGAKRYDYTKMQLQRMDKNFNYGKDALNAWTPENTNTNIPRAVQGDPNGNNRISDRYVENGDYIRLNNLQIGYNLSSKVCKYLGISNLRVYVGGSRLFTITRYDGYDPAVGADVGLMGVDEAIYPLSRTYMAGLNFSF